MTPLLRLLEQGREAARSAGTHSFSQSRYDPQKVSRGASQPGQLPESDRQRRYRLEYGVHAGGC